MDSVPEYGSFSSTAIQFLTFLPIVRKNSYYGATAIVAGWGVTQTRMIRGSPVKVRALPDRAKHVKVKVKKCEVGGARAEFDYPVGVLCASDTSERMV